MTTASKSGPLTSPGQLVAPMEFHDVGHPIESDIDSKSLQRDTKLQGMESFVKYAGVFDMEGLYKLILRWFEEREFEVWESLYKAKLPELEIRWEAQKKIDVFRMDKVNIHLHFHDVRDVIVEKDGVKKKLAYAHVRVWTWPEVVTDYPNMFGERRFVSPFDKKLLIFLNRYVLRRDVELRDLDRLYYELWGLHAQIKAFFNMEAKGNAY